MAHFCILARCGTIVVAARSRRSKRRAMPSPSFRMSTPPSQKLCPRAVLAHPTDCACSDRKGPIGGHALRHHCRPSALCGAAVPSHGYLSRRQCSAYLINTGDVWGILTAGVPVGPDDVSVRLNGACTATPAASSPYNVAVRVHRARDGPGERVSLDAVNTLYGTSLVRPTLPYGARSAVVRNIQIHRSP